METIQLVLPAVATLALGTALLVPLRDDRRGRRATLGGPGVPLRPEFGALRSDGTGTDEAPTRTFVGDVATTGVVAAAGSVSSNPPRNDADDSATGARPVLDGDGAAVSHASRQADVTDASSVAGPQADIETERVGTDDAVDLRSFGQPNLKQSTSRSYAFLQRLRSRIFSGVKTDEVQTLPNLQRSNATADVEIERSFATQLASLLGVNELRHVEADTPHVTSDLPQASTGDTVARTESLELSEQPIARQGFSLESDRNETPVSTHVVRPFAIGVDRVLPITRLPLRPHGLAITWTRDPLGDERDPTTPNDRHALLERLERDAGCVGYATIERAYHEEDVTGRTLALRVMIAKFATEGRATFVNALHTGTDDERALAIDGLSAGDARDALPAAFADRVDAIAARAALEYVGVATRATYRAVLSPFIDASKLEALLVLLAGIIE